MPQETAKTELVSVPTESRPPDEPMQDIRGQVGYVAEKFGLSVDATEAIYAMFCGQAARWEAKVKACEDRIRNQREEIKKLAASSSLLPVPEEERTWDSLRDLAVQIVDNSCGYTMEFAGSPVRHRQNYDWVEDKLNEVAQSRAGLPVGRQPLKCVTCGKIDLEHECPHEGKIRWHFTPVASLPVGESTPCTGDQDCKHVCPKPVQLDGLIYAGGIPIEEALRDYERVCDLVYPPNYEGEDSPIHFIQNTESRNAQNCVRGVVANADIGRLSKER